MMENGRAWARFWLIVGVVVSIGGNTANACLTDAHADLWIRVVLAVIWPAFLFGGVEVLVRNRDVSGWLARFGQLGLLAVSVPTAVTSYVNLHALMIKAGEPGTAQVTGPLAIDGLMLGCTIMLLASRTVASAPAAAPDPDEALERWATPVDLSDWSTEELVESIPEAPVFPAPVQARAPRGEIAPALRTAIEALTRGEKPEYGPGASRAVVDRYAKVMRILKDDPNAVIDAGKEKVKPMLVDEIRAAMRELAPR